MVQQQGPLILVVDDDPDVGRYMAATLYRDGYRALQAESLDQALSIFSKRRDDIELVLMDVVMSDMPGPNLVTLLRRDAPHLRVLYVSGYPREHLIQYGAELKSNPLLSKPFTPKELLNAVSRAIGKAQATN